MPAIARSRVGLRVASENNNQDGVEIYLVNIAIAEKRVHWSFLALVQYSRALLFV